MKSVNTVLGSMSVILVVASGCNHNHFVRVLRSMARKNARQFSFDDCAEKYGILAYNLSGLLDL